MVSPDQTITAEDRFEYQVLEGRVVAVGRPKVVRPKPQGAGEDTLESDELVAILKDNGKGERVIDMMEAKGHVVITTPGEIVTGAYGVYKAGTNKIELSGGVTITRGPNVLEGERAVVDLDTNTSQMFGSPIAGGRVRGVFYPGSEKKPKHKEQIEKAEESKASPVKPVSPAVEVSPLPELESIEPEAGAPSSTKSWTPFMRP